MAVAVALLIIVFVLLKSSAPKARDECRDWMAAADALQLSFSGHAAERRIAGKLDSVAVEAHYHRTLLSRRRATEVTRLQAGSRGQIPEHLAARWDHVGRRLGRLLEPDEQIGHPAFDAVVELPRVDALVCAALSAEARDQLLSVLEIGGVVRGGKVSLETEGKLANEREWLVERLPSLAKLARLLQVPPGAMHQRLAENALRDPIRNVRLRNFRFLIAPRSGTPSELQEATARALLADEDASLRLLAAQQLGTEGHAVLGAIAADASTDTGLRKTALASLDEVNAPTLGTLLPGLLRAEATEIVCRALAIAAVRGGGKLASELYACARSPHAEVRAAAATALARVPAPETEQILLQLLGNAEAEVQLASAAALGAVGSVLAVEPLLQLADRFGRAQLRQAARAAIGSIQSRLGAVEAGSLSLADQQLAGAVDLAEPAEEMLQGELSLAEPEATEPSSRRS